MAAERVEVRTAAQMWRAGDLILDVRTPEEYATGHIAGALNVPIGLLPFAARDLPPGAILTACSRGGRAARAAELLDHDGRAAFIIDGGTVEWERSGMPIVRGAEPGARRPKPGWLGRFSHKDERQDRGSAK